MAWYLRKNECKKHGCPELIYEVNAGDPGDLLVCVDGAPDALVESKVIEKGPVEGPVNEAIISCLIGKELRASEIAQAIGQSSRSGYFKRCLRELLKREIIEVVGLKDKSDPTRKYRLKLQSK